MRSGTKLPLGLCWISVVCLMLGLASGEVVKCYECKESDTSCGPPLNSIGRVQECPNSTMCSKITRIHELNGKQWKTTRRGCARQVNKTQDYVVKEWVDVYVVMDLPEGCTKTDKAEYCNCRGSLCNSASFPSSNFRLPTLLIFLALVCGKILLPV
ncbi:uncharacterized protein LOC108046199 [Drosophila rhopaloa]|uniref:Uncharacterized protein LOC108046199 n=1 Tax=Drosophila rhopaloa TaxID=1041015 RepID=A0A6P4F7C6_DRORH|nr:uncharacterized protein LOC108046199 [Drosophila rhopaloa]